MLRRVTFSFPTPFNLFNYAKALAFRHQIDATREWMEKMQKVQPDSYMKNLRDAWTVESRQQPAMAAVPWPAPDEKP
jgi:hypothetical protein